MSTKVALLPCSMPRPASLVFNIRQAALEQGLSPFTAYSRRARGITAPEKMFSGGRLAPREHHRRGEPVTLKGVTYVSKSAAAKAFGLSRALVQQRELSGWSLEDALTTPKGQPNPNPTVCSLPKAPAMVVVQGRIFSSFKAACLHFGVRYSTAASRLRMGWSTLEALELVERQRPARKSQ